MKRKFLENYWTNIYWITGVIILCAVLLGDV